MIAAKGKKTAPTEEKNWTKLPTVCCAWFYAIFIAAMKGVEENLTTAMKRKQTKKFLEDI